MDNIDAAKEWINIAQADFASANYLQNMQPIPIEIICYHCQQSAEKYLKGFLAKQGEEIRKTHDLVLLNSKCQEFDNEFKKLEEECLMLTDFAVNVRYPYKLDINESDMRLALTFAKNIKELVLSKLGF